MIRDKGDERRKRVKSPSFPMLDSEGNKVSEDRRSGKERRKNNHGDDIAKQIIDP